MAEHNVATINAQMIHDFVVQLQREIQQLRTENSELKAKVLNAVALAQSANKRVTEATQKRDTRLPTAQVPVKTKSLPKKAAVLNAVSSIGTPKKHKAKKKRSISSRLAPFPSNFGEILKELLIKCRFKDASGWAHAGNLEKTFQTQMRKQFREGIIPQFTNLLMKHSDLVEHQQVGGGVLFVRLRPIKSN